MMAMSWQRPFKELNPKVEELIVKVLEEGKGAGQSPAWQTLGSVTQLDCHNPLCQRGGVDLNHTLREMVATRRAELENVKMRRGVVQSWWARRLRIAFPALGACKDESDVAELIADAVPRMKRGVVVEIG